MWESNGGDGTCPENNMKRKKGNEGEEEERGNKET